MRSIKFSKTKKNDNKTTDIIKNVLYNNDLYNKIQSYLPIIPSTTGNLYNRTKSTRSKFNLLETYKSNKKFQIKYNNLENFIHRLNDNLQNKDDITGIKIFINNNSNVRVSSRWSILRDYRAYSFLALIFYNKNNIVLNSFNLEILHEESIILTLYKIKSILNLFQRLRYCYLVMDDSKNLNELNPFLDRIRVVFTDNFLKYTSIYMEFIDLYNREKVIIQLLTKNKKEIYDIGYYEDAFEYFLNNII